VEKRSATTQRPQKPRPPPPGSGQDWPARQTERRPSTRIAPWIGVGCPSFTLPSSINYGCDEGCGGATLRFTLVFYHRSMQSSNSTVYVSLGRKWPVVNFRRGPWLRAGCPGWSDGFPGQDAPGRLTRKKSPHLSRSKTPRLADAPGGFVRYTGGGLDGLRWNLFDAQSVKNMESGRLPPTTGEESKE
jgi:hypothetical protein